MKARYVVLHHTGIAEPHFDLMFDLGEDAPLTTWRSPIWPIDRPTALTRLADHRREYLTYEGDLSGDRGNVERIAQGACDVEITETRWALRWNAPAIARLELSHRTDDRWSASPLFD